MSRDLAMARAFRGLILATANLGVSLLALLGLFWCWDHPHSPAFMISADCGWLLAASLIGAQAWIFIAARKGRA